MKLVDSLEMKVWTPNPIQNLQPSKLIKHGIMEEYDGSCRILSLATVAYETFRNLLDISYNDKLFTWNALGRDGMVDAIKDFLVLIFGI